MFLFSEKRKKRTNNNIKQRQEEETACRKGGGGRRRRDKKKKKDEDDGGWWWRVGRIVEWGEVWLSARGIVPREQWCSQWPPLLLLLWYGRLQPYGTLSRPLLHPHSPPHKFKQKQQHVLFSWKQENMTEHATTSTRGERWWNVHVRRQNCYLTLG